MFEMPPVPPEIWLIGSIEAEPFTRLVDWRVFPCQLPGLDGATTTHLVGYSPRNREGRVSFPIETLAPSKRLVKTRSGRADALLGSPGSCGDADHTWTAWLRINEATVVAEVTKQHYAQIEPHHVPLNEDPQP